MVTHNMDEKCVGELSVIYLRNAVTANQGTEMSTATKMVAELGKLFTTVEAHFKTDLEYIKESNVTFFTNILTMGNIKMHAKVC